MNLVESNPSADSLQNASGAKNTFLLLTSKKNYKTDANVLSESQSNLFHDENVLIIPNNHFLNISKN